MHNTGNCIQNVFREDETPIDFQDLMLEARLALELPNWARMGDLLEIPRIYHYTRNTNPRNMHFKYWMRLSEKLIEKLADIRYEYEKRIEELEAELRGENGLCGHCPIRMKLND